MPVAFLLMKRDTKVQECDATMLIVDIKAGYKKIYISTGSYLGTNNFITNHAAK